MNRLFFLVPLVLASSAAFGQTADRLVIEGRALLVAKDITNANSRFAAAVGKSPNHQTANLLHAGTRLLSWPYTPVAQDMMDRLGMPLTNRSIYDWTAELPRDTNHVIVPPNDFNSSELVTLARTSVLTEITGALGDLAKVADPNFILNLASNETTITAVTLDYGDVQMLRAFLHTAEFLIYTVNSYNLSAQLNALYAMKTRDELTIDRLLASYPQALTFATTSDLPLAKAAFAKAVDAYVAASDVIRARPTNIVRLFNYDPDVAQEEAKFRQTLVELKASLAKPVTLTYVTNKTGHITANLARAFDGSKPLRSMLPVFRADGIVLGSLPDATFNGLIFGLSESDIYRALGAQVPMLPNIRTVRRLADGRLQLAANAMDDRFYAIEASSNLVVWVSIATVTATNGLLTFTDQLLGSLQRRFYRAHEVTASGSGSAPQVNTERLVWIPPGRFTMGSPVNQIDPSYGESPQTVVTISRGFWIGKYEVTQGEYIEVMGSNPSWFNGNRQNWPPFSGKSTDFGMDLSRPLEMVMWNDATNYCGKLTQRDRKAGRIPNNFLFRLPTEAEWEYACRAGTTTQYSFGSNEGSPKIVNYAWYADSNGLGMTHPVGQKSPNPWGLYDMHGNVWEWCLDWYGKYSGGTAIDPQGPASGSDRVIRSGGWCDAASSSRSARRNKYAPDRGEMCIGFRVVLAPGQP